MPLCMLRKYPFDRQHPRPPVCAFVFVVTFVFFVTFVLRPTKVIADAGSSTPGQIMFAVREIAESLSGNPENGVANRRLD